MRYVPGLLGAAHRRRLCGDPAPLGVVAVGGFLLAIDRRIG